MAPNLYISQEAFAALHFAAEPFLVRWFQMLYSGGFLSQYEYLI
jgi:hypothetical protein